MLDIKTIGSYYIIDGIGESGQVTSLRSLRTGESFHVEKDDFSAATFNPLDWGFKETATGDFVNQELFLHDYTTLKEYVGSGTLELKVGDSSEVWDIDGMPVFSHLGYQVKKKDSDNWLIDGTEIVLDEYKSKDGAENGEDDEDSFVGMQFVHELQNLYTIEFPNVGFDIKPFLNKALK